MFPISPTSLLLPCFVRTPPSPSYQFPRHRDSSPSHSFLLLSNASLLRAISVRPEAGRSINKMLTCIARLKQPTAANDALPSQLPDAAAAAADPGAKNPSVSSITFQLKDMALKASGAYRSCCPCGGLGVTPARMKGHVESDAESDRFHWSYRRQGSSGSNSSYNASQRFVWGKGGNSSGDVMPSSGTGSRRKEPAVGVFVEEKEPKEWVTQVELGVLIDFLSLPGGGNDLRRVRFRLSTETHSLPSWY